jgi:lysophospholipase L1-like esterase
MPPGKRYLRFAALGDSTTYGVGDPVLPTVSGSGWRGWARLLSDALATTYDVSFCNLAVSGATATTVLGAQLADGVAHRPDLASLVVGINDTFRSRWDPARLREELFTCAEALTGAGAVLLTARFHDHGEVWNLPNVIRRPLFERIEAVNTVYDELHEVYAGVRVDLAARPEIRQRECWSVDRLHPSERGHRMLAIAFAEGLAARGLDVVPPSPDQCDGLPTTWRRELAWVLAEGGPWMGRRARDLGPTAVRLAWRAATSAQDVLPAEQRVAEPQEQARVEQ